jgi:hypothetical protein
MGNKDKVKNLGGLKAAWAKGLKQKDEVLGTSFVPEDGKYIVAVTDATLGESQSSGRTQIDWEFTFLEGDYKGKTRHVYDGLDRPEGLPYVMRRISGLGFEVPEDVDDLEGVLLKIAKAQPRCRVRIKSKDDFVNIYILNLVDEDGNAVEAQEKSEEDVKEAEEEGEETNHVEAEKPEAVEEEGIDIVPGLKVRCFDEDEKEVGVGEVVAVDEKEGEVTVRLEKTGKKQIFTADQIRVLPKAKEEPKAKAGLRARK